MEKPEYWLIEFSTEGDSEELEGLIVRADERVYLGFLRLAYHAWVEGRISDEEFSACCSTLWKQAGYQSRWYRDLLWIEDEFDLVDQAILGREDSVKRIRTALEKLLMGYEINFWAKDEKKSIPLDSFEKAFNAAGLSVTVQPDQSGHRLIFSGNESSLNLEVKGGAVKCGGMKFVAGEDPAILDKVLRVLRGLGWAAADDERVLE